jgi:hypothetical protein
MANRTPTSGNLDTGTVVTFISLSCVLLFLLISLFDHHIDAFEGPRPALESLLLSLPWLGAFLFSTTGLILGIIDIRRDQRRDAAVTQAIINGLVLFFFFIGTSFTLIITLIALVGTLSALVGLIWIIIAGFQVNAAWGLICLFIPLGFVVFAIMNWPVAKKPFLTLCLGFLVLFFSLPILASLRF